MNLLRKAFNHEIRQGKESVNRGDLDTAFHHFERAHILGQAHAWRHTASHLQMLRVGYLRGDWREIVGQLFRIPTGFLGSIIGVFPIGNTGGANVNPFRSMEVPSDLKAILAQTEPRQ